MTYECILVAYRYRRKYLLRLITFFVPLTVMTSAVITLTGCSSIWNMCSPPIAVSVSSSEDTPLRGSSLVHELHFLVSDNTTTTTTTTEPPPIVKAASQLNKDSGALRLDCTTLSFIDDVYNNNNNNICSSPILTMFTTMHESDKDRLRVHINTLLNWGMLGSCVTRILYVENKTSTLAHIGYGAGWRVEHVPQTLHDIPVLKSMFLTSFNTTSTPLYLYANADILFDFSIVKTSRALLCALLARQQQRSPPTDAATSASNDNGGTPPAAEFNDDIFAVGQRTNVPLKEIDPLLVRPSDVAALTIGKKLFVDIAQDYFLCSFDRGWNANNFEVITDVKTSFFNTATTQSELVNRTNPPPNCSYGIECYSARGSSSRGNTNETKGYFPWDEVPDFVIGRPGYDNWLVAQAVLWSVPWTIDLTNTVHAVHQTGRFGVKSGRDSPAHYKTLYVNYEMTAQDYYFEGGSTGCVRWFSVYGLNKLIVFLQRPTVHPNCVKAKVLTSKSLKHRLIRRRLMNDWRWRNHMAQDRLEFLKHPLERYAITLKSRVTNESLPSSEATLAAQVVQHDPVIVEHNETISPQEMLRRAELRKNLRLWRQKLR